MKEIIKIFENSMSLTITTKKLLMEGIQIFDLRKKWYSPKERLIKGTDVLIYNKDDKYYLV